MEVPTLNGDKFVLLNEVEGEAAGVSEALKKKGEGIPVLLNVEGNDVLSPILSPLAILLSNIGVIPSAAKGKGSLDREARGGDQRKSLLEGDDGMMKELGACFVAFSFPSVLGVLCATRSLSEPTGTLSSPAGGVCGSIC